MKKETKDSQLDIMRHSTSHLMAAAVKDLFGEKVKFAIGPTIEDGFYYDFDLGDKTISEDDLPKIEKKMKHMVKQNLKFQREEVSIKDALNKEKGQDYKKELIKDLEREGNKKVSFYKLGEVFEDLCSGPHVESTNKIGPFKLLSVAGAYWRGNENNKMLQRIYGTAFANKEELDAYLKMREEAEKRDHRKIGKEQELFFIDELVGKGLPIWLPNGTVIKDEIQKLAVEYEKKHGYVRVSTPHLGKKELYLTSGHLPYYEDDMYPAMEMDDGTYYLKAMNCPHHHLVYKQKPRSYRDLPIRIGEYGTVYRNELSGTLAGLLRVRMLQMHDGHIYCTKDQIKEEVKKVIESINYYYDLFGLGSCYFRLSKGDIKNKKKYIDQPKNWQYAEKVLKEVLDELKVEYIEAEDEAAFYGPKIDVQFKSVIGREETMSTVQLDFLAKERFELSYKDKDGKDNNEVFVIHRAPLSTHERFIAFLIEHYAGAWPVWLAPVQVKLLPVSDKFNKYAQEVKEKLEKTDIRVELDDSAETLGKKIRNGEQEKAPYLLVIGEKEVKNKEVAVRKRGKGDLGPQKLDKFIISIIKERDERKL